MATGADTPLLLCYDGSEAARRAIVRAAGVLRIRDAVVLTVWQPTLPSAALPGRARLRAWSTTSSSIGAAAELGERIANEGARVAQGAGLQTEPVAVEGHRTGLEDDP